MTRLFGPAAMIVEIAGAAGSQLNLTDCNEIANRLIDARRELLLASEKGA